tara:strand:- start:17 stop:259 length:243 start_codon:yes stop_codon:yes gene_type:complete
VLEEIEVTIHIDASADKSMPMNALQLNVCIVFLEFEVNSFSEIDVWALNGMHVFSCHLELVKVEVLWEYLHFYLFFKDYR